MNDQIPATATQPQQAQQPQAFANDEISLVDIIAKLWARRGILASICLVAAVITGGGLLVARSFLPQAQYLEQPFKITFDGVLDGHYPNGQIFNYADIADISILKTALDESELKGVLSLEDLGKAIIIVETNDDLEKAQQIFQARLKNDKLTVAERSQIETEYHERMDALRKPLFKIRWYGENTSTLPRAAIEKLLADILSAWAKDAIERKRAFKLNGGILSAAILQTPTFETKDALMRIDAYRHVLQKASEQINALRTLPGSEQIRLKSGTSLEELSLQLQQLNEFRLPMLIELARSLNSNTTSDFSDRLYAETRLDSLHLQESLLSDQDKVLKNSWDMQGNINPSENSDNSGNYSNHSQQPSFSMGGSMDGALLDHMVELVESAGRVKYRQNLLDKIIEHGYAVANLKKEIAFYERYGKNKATQESDQKQNRLVFDQQIQAMNLSTTSLLTDMQSIHDEISAVQFHRSGSLYATTGPLTYNAETTLSLKKMLMIFVGILALIIGVSVTAVLTTSPDKE